MVLVASSSMAQITYSSGDFLLGFRATGGTGAASDVLVDLGPGTFLTSSVPVTFTLGNLNSQLTGTFGASWFTRTDLFYGAAAATQTGDATRTLYASFPDTGIGGVSDNPWARLGNTAAQAVINKINGEGLAYNNYSPTAAAPAVVQGTTDTNSYASYMPGGTSTNAGPAPGISYAQFNPTIEASNPSGSSLDIIQLVPSATTGQPGTDLGDLSIDSNGVVTFTPEAAEVPEPSTSASIALGTGLLVAFVIHRRNRLVNQY